MEFVPLFSLVRHRGSVDGKERLASHQSLPTPYKSNAASTLMTGIASIRTGRSGGGQRGRDGGAAVSRRRLHAAVRSPVSRSGWLPVPEARTSLPVHRGPAFSVRP